MGTPAQRDRVIDRALIDWFLSLSVTERLRENDRANRTLERMRVSDLLVRLGPPRALLTVDALIEVKALR